MTVIRFLAKTNQTGSLLQTINGILLLTTFFVARLCYGGWMVIKIFLTKRSPSNSTNDHAFPCLQSIRFFYTLQEVQAEVPTILKVVFILGNLTLQGLNWFWSALVTTANCCQRVLPKINRFYTMILSLQKRVNSKIPKPTHHTPNALSSIAQAEGRKNK